jgi:hypothetical protein
MKKERFVLDTSMFVNPEAKYKFGRKPTAAFLNFLKLAEGSKRYSFYMPPSIYAELMNFVDSSKIPAKLLSVVHKKAPKKYELTLPALFLYELVNDMRKRVDKGLRLAEKGIKQAQETKKIDEIIKKIRHDYRAALRTDTIDSKEDVDLILLAKELKATLISVDNGAILWAHKLGIKCREAKELKSLLKNE